MSDSNPRISPQAETMRPVAAGRQRGGIVPGGGPRRLSPPYPVGTLGQLVDLPQENVLVSAFQAVNSIHGGLGCAAFRLEEGLALTSVDSEGDTEIEEMVAYAEAVVPGGVLSERFLHAAGSLLLQACEPVALEAARTGEAILAEATLAGGRCQVMAVPCREGGRVTAVLCRAQELQHRGEAASLAALQATTLLRLLAEMRGESHRVRARFGRVAALLELLGASAVGVDFSECARRLANHLRETLECGMVALSLKTWRSHRIVAVSGETGPVESHSPGRRAMLSHLAEAMHQGRPLLFRREGQGGKSAAPQSATLREWFDPAISFCLPLVDREGKTRGGWLFLWDESPSDFSEKKALIEAATPEMAPMLSLLHRAKPGSAVGTVLRLWKNGSINARKAAIAMGTILLVSALVPLPYPVRATCELQPVVRRVIAAPFDGVLLRSVAKAGELVNEGQLLAEMDGRELRSQLAEAVARRERAAKEADLSLAEGKVAEARMAELEAEGLANEIELLEYRQSHLEVRSPIHGLVLQGDLERSEGAPLRVGDPLFEVGPLDRLVAEVAVSATDVSLVSEGARVKLKLESDASGVIEGTIGRVSPKSEWREDRNVFICEVEIANPDGALRAGLKGKAKVSGPRRPLVWIWARDAWLAFRYHLW